MSTGVETEIPCVVLISGDPVPDEALAEQLQIRRWRAMPTASANLAMAELCLLAAGCGAEDLGGRREGPVLVIVPPVAADGSYRPKDLVEAVRAYVPSASVWLYINGGLSAICGAAAAVPASSDAPRHAETDDQRRGTRVDHADSREEPDLHLVGTGHPSPERPVEPTPAEDIPASDDAGCSRITAEELEMLFHGEQDERGPI